MSGARLGAIMLVLGAAAPAGAAETGDPAAILRRLYAAYPLPGTREPPLIARPEAWLAAPLLTLWRRDRAAAAAGQGVGAVDWDPVCGCQDDTGLHGVGVSTAAGSGASTRATVRFVLGGRLQVVAYRLVATADGWRIADIMTRAVPSLAAHLRATLAHPAPD